MQRLDEQVSLQDIAAVSELTPYRIYRAFQKEVGMTPHDFPTSSQDFIGYIKDFGTASRLLRA